MNYQPFTRLKYNLYIFRTIIILWITCCMNITDSASSLPVMLTHDTVPATHPLPGRAGEGGEGKAGVEANESWQGASSAPYDTPPSYPGGAQAWSMHLMKNLRYPANAWNKKITGHVLVRFTINEKGRLRDFKAITGPDELRDEAIRVIAASGRWTPAMLNGKPVASQKEQAIQFRLE